MKFTTCLNCMDGRVQLPIIYWIMDNLLKKIDISIEKHNSSIIFVVGHYDCGGNPVDDETHKKQIRIAVEKVKRWKPSIPVIGLWVSNEWIVEKITEK